MKSVPPHRAPRGSAACSHRWARSIPPSIVVALAPAFAWTLLASAARAQAAAPTVDFSADHAVVDPDQAQLSLDGNVRAGCGRYRLRADRLRLALRNGGLDVDGPAEVTLCPCPDAPITIAFDRARVDPPSDLVVHDPKMRVGGTTVAWLPVLWLRTPDRPGLLVPRLAWRGRDGLLIGPGFHLPWRNADNSLSTLQLYVSGYTSGGVELDSTLRTPESVSRVRFDHASGTLTAAESQGAVGSSRSPVLAWSADVARGQRARSGWIEIDRSARRFDDARAHVSVHDGLATVAAGVEAAGVRAPDARFTYGPVGLVHAGDALGSAAAWQLDTSARMLDDGTALFEVLRADGRVDGGALVGPLALGLTAQGRSLGVVGPARSASDLSASSTLRAAVPLARRYGPQAAPWLHVVEPFVAATAVGARTTGDPYPAALRPPALPSGSRWIAQGGARTAVGAPSPDQGASLQLAAGAVGSFTEPSDALPAVLSRAAADLGVVGLGAELAGVLRARRPGAAAISFARFGREHSSHLRVLHAWRSELDPVDARSLAYDDGAVGASWLDAQGHSLVPGATLLLLHGFRLFGDGWWGAPGLGFLGARGGIAYRHPCGCIDASMQVAQRKGREGTDAWLSLDLAP